MFWFPANFRVVITVHGFRKSIIKGITGASKGRDSANLSETFAITNRRELAARVRVTRRPGKVFAPGPSRYSNRVGDGLCFHVFWDPQPTIILE